LVIGDVPVEETYHGSLLLYRLLESYPAAKLKVIETARPSTPENRLAGVEYDEIPIGNSRWLNTRFHSWVTLWFNRVAERANRFLPVVETGNFESVLTVMHGFGWLAAARVAEQAKVPLHLIVHDDWPRVAHIPKRFRQRLDRQFKRVYCQAASRMCVSPGMRSSFFERYGKDADILFPSRGVSCPNFEISPSRLQERTKPFTVVFAGTVNSEGYVLALIALSRTLESMGGRLLIFGPLDELAARSYGLVSPSISLGGLLAPEELLLRLRDEADCLFVPMSFDPADRANMELAFPSKLADYTAVGVPLIIYGPPYCSAVKWARENDEVAEVVDNEDASLLGSAVERLAADADLRIRLGERALTVGRSYFSAGNAQRLLESVLLRSL
jgi:glycosyltransferase involved in cell wall biosynthesis